MLDTNTITNPAATPAVQSALSAANLVALSVGVFVTHVYHTVVNAGGLKNIVRNFWSGNPKS